VYSIEDRATPVRLEIFHQVSDLENIKHTPVPDFPFHEWINAYYTSHVNEVMTAKLNDAMEPLLQTFAKPLPDGSAKNFHRLSMAAKVSLIYQAEIVSQILGIGVSSPILGSVERIRDRPVFHEVPSSKFVVLSPEEMLQTGLKYGIDPLLLTSRRFVPRSLTIAATSQQREQSTRFHLYCVSLGKKLRQVCMFVQKEEQILSILREASTPQDPLEEDDIEEEITVPHCVFEMPHYASLLKLSVQSRLQMLKKICYVYSKCTRMSGLV
jgi:hypothetical protein